MVDFDDTAVDILMRSYENADKGNFFIPFRHVVSREYTPEIEVMLVQIFILKDEAVTLYVSRDNDQT